MAAVAAIVVGVVVVAGAVAGAQPVTDPLPPPPKLELRVGETAVRDVGIALGYRCDEPSLLAIELRTKDAQSNLFVVTGVREGSTLCRVGTDPNRPSVVFDIRVLPRRDRR